MRFDLAAFIECCRAARDGGADAVREIVARAVSEPDAVLSALGEPTRAAMQVLYRGSDLTIFNIIWAPMMSMPPHDHRLWSVIGVYTGREDNILWRRTPGRPDKVEAAGALSLGRADAVPFGADVIHSVINPITMHTAAIHVYGGDFFAAGRSEWNPETLVAETVDPRRALRRFEEANQKDRPAL